MNLYQKKICCKTVQPALVYWSNYRKYLWTKLLWTVAACFIIPIKWEQLLEKTEVLSERAEVKGTKPNDMAHLLSLCFLKQQGSTATKTEVS